MRPPPRRAPLPALLRARGLHLREVGEQNFHLREHPGIIVKDCFWREEDSERAGNAIDFFIYVLGMSFAEAMEQITRG